MDLIKEIKNIKWFNLPNKLVDILLRIVGLMLPIPPNDNVQYGMENGQWTEIVTSSGGIESVSGDSVDNTDPLNPIINDSRPYKVYSAKVNQSGTNNPSATVFENTLGGIPTWTRTETGLFLMTLTGAFPNQSKIFISSLKPSFDTDGTNIRLRDMYHNDTNSLELAQITEGIGYSDTLSGGVYVEVRVYN